MGVVNSGSIPTARNVAMVTARRRVRTWTQRVAWRHTTRRPNDAAMVNINTTLLTRRAVTVVLFPDPGLVYFSLDASRIPEGRPEKYDFVLSRVSRGLKLSNGGFFLCLYISLPNHEGGMREFETFENSLNFLSV